MKWIAIFIVAPLFAQDDGLVFHGPIKDVAPHVARLGEVRIAVDPAAAEMRVDFSIPSAAGPSDIVHAFDRVLESLQMALVARDQGYEVVPFVAEAPSPHVPRMEVAVAEGTVDLVGDKGRVAVPSGQESRLDATGKPAPPTPTDRERIGAWREAPIGQAPPVVAKVPLPALRVRRIGRTSDHGLAIVEYSLPPVETADGSVVEVEPTKVVLESADAEVVVPVRVRLR